MTPTPASLITKAASSQTYYTIRLLVDRARVEDAYRAYGYFRWVDDTLDTQSASDAERRAFLERQQRLLASCERDEPPQDVTLPERMLVELVMGDRGPNTGLRIYLRNMMRVMAFDVGRRGRLIWQAELNEYTRWLASAVTECIHYFIGHDGYAPQDGTRYLAVTAAHMAHMLRDTFEDAALGYYNIPREVLEAHALGPLDVESHAYRAWVQARVEQARRYFRAGKEYFARVESLRCRVACYAYMARFEWLLARVERERYLLRPEYGERKTVGSGLEMLGLTLSSLWEGRAAGGVSGPVSAPREGKAWRHNP